MPTWLEDQGGLILPADADRVDDGEHLAEAAHQVSQFIDEAEELAWLALDQYDQDTGPREQRKEVRARLIRQSRAALLRDPVAGAEAMHLMNFAFSRGIPKPTAEDPEVQKVFDEAWTDPVNEEALTGFDALRKLSNDLLTSANLFAVGFGVNGMFRVGFEQPERVQEIITDPDNEARALYYLVSKRTRKWDFDQDQWISDQAGEPKKVYYPHWRNVAAYEEEVGRGAMRPPKGKLGDGEMYHVRVNRVGAAQFGTPPWARTLRFYSGLNRLTEARIAMAQAAAAFIAKRVTKGGPASVQKAAQSVLRQAGDLSATLRTGEAPGMAPGMQPAPRPASIFSENEAHSLQPLSLQSGGGAAQADVQIARAPLSAASGFGQHYLGDASNANLATATTLELPALMQVGAWQESFEQLIRWFCDRTLEEAVRAGRLGGATADGEKPLTELRLAEAADKADAEERTGRTLDYSFAMPYPGRRNLPDVTALVTATVATFDAGLQNQALLKTVLTFLFSEGYGLEDPAGVAEEVLNFELPPPPAEIPPEAPMEQPGPTGPGPSDEKSIQGEKRKGSPPKNEMSEQVEDADVVAFVAEIDALWRQHMDVDGLIAQVDGNGHP